MSEMPAIGTETEKVVTARKQYKCGECSKLINKGDKYTSYAACWPSINGWATVRTCIRCGNLRNQTLLKYPPYYPEEGPAFGELREYISEARR